MKSEIFKPEDIANIDDHARAIEQLERLGNFWIGQDVSLERKIIIPPLKVAANLNLKVNKSDFPAIDINKGAIGALDWSVRSCLAQTGVEIRFHRADLTEEMLKNIRKGKNVVIPISIWNHLKRPLELEGRVMRFFWVNDRKRLRHGELRQAMKSDFKVEGREGEDWFFGDAEFEDGVKPLESADPVLEKDLCVILPLRQKYYVPESAEPLAIRSKKDLPGVLREIPAGLEEEFKIGETARVKLGSNIIAVINTGVVDKNRRHIHSPLIDPGFEGSIRTETVHGLDSIDLFLYRK